MVFNGIYLTNKLRFGCLWKWGIPLSSSHQIIGINGDYPMDEVPYSQTNPLVGKCLYCFGDFGDFKHHLNKISVGDQNKTFLLGDVQVGHLPMNVLGGNCMKYSIYWGIKNPWMLGYGNRGILLQCSWGDVSWRCQWWFSIEKTWWCVWT